MRYVLASLSLLISIGTPSLVAVGQEPAAGKPLRVINLEVVIADVPEGATEVPAPAAILGMEKSGKLGSVSRFKLTILEQQRGMVQFSELMPRATGRTMLGGFRGGDGAGAGPRSSTVYSDISIGTMLSAMARVENDGQIAIDLKLSRSRLIPQKAEGAADAAGDFTPSSVATLTVESSLKAKPGEATLVGGRHTTGGKETAQTWVVLTATVAAGPASGTSSKAAVSPAAAEIKVFQLKYAAADQLAAVLKQVFSGAPVVITADPRSNALLVRGPSERLSVVSGLLNDLDTGERHR